MDPNRSEPIEAVEKNARIMYIVGFCLVPLSWLVCFLYSSKHKAESEYLNLLSKKVFILWWGAVILVGFWTLLYSAFWPSMEVIGYNVPSGEPE